MTHGVGRQLIASNGVVFTRLAGGDVQLLIRSGDGALQAVRTIDAGTWASAVLAMTEFSERPGDWAKWTAHHQGRTDRLADPPSPEKSQ